MKNKLCFLLAVFAAVVLATEAISAPVVYEVPAYAAYLTTSESTIWAGRTLSELTSFSGTINGAYLGKDVAATGFIVSRGDNQITVQFQTKEATYCRAVRAYFKQSGADIVGWADKSAAINDPSLFGTVLPDSAFFRDLATSADTPAYGVYNLMATGDDTWVVETLPDASDGIVVNGGMLRVNVSTDVDVTQAISGTGKLKFSSSQILVREIVFEKYLTTSDQVVLPETDLFDVEIVSGTMNGSGWTWITEGIYNVTTNREARTISFQVQGHPDWKNAPYGVRVVLRQDGFNVVGKADLAAYAQSGTPFGSDMATWGNERTVATSATSKDYGVESLTFCVRSAPVVRLSGTKNWVGGTIADGVILKVRESALSATGVAEAMNGAVIDLGVDLGGASSRAGRYEIGENSILRLVGNYPLANADVVVINGGNMDAVGLFGYIDQLELRDGACVSAENARIGNSNGDSVWKVAGDAPSESLSPLTLVTTSGGSGEWVLDLSTNLFLKGEVKELSSRKGLQIVKRGGGTAVFESGCASTGCMVLEAGGLAASSSVSFGKLNLVGDAAIEVATGGMMSFEDSSDVIWAQGKKLYASGSFGDADKTLRFGTSAEGLTAEQIRAVRLNGQRCRLDAEGYAHAYTPGVIIVVR